METKQMNIAFLPEDRRTLKNLQVDKIDDFNEDSFWIAAIIKDVPPEFNNFLFLFNPKTKYSITHRLKGNWRNNIKENIETAFLREFENLREKGVEAGSYKDFLENINFTQIPKQHLNLVKEIRDRADELAILFYFLETPEEYYYSDFEINRYKTFLNYHNEEDSNYAAEDKFEEVLMNYENYDEEKEVSFEKNKKALELPKNPFITKRSNPWDLEKTIIMDSTALRVKEPHEVNFNKIQKINEKIERLIKHGRKNPEYKDRNQKLIDELFKQIDKYLTYDQSPFFGMSEDLQIPNPLPEKPVFKFFISLDTGYHLALREVAVSGDMTFTDFDKLLLHLYRWTGFPYHMSSFIFPLKNKPEGKEASEILVWQDEDLPEDILKRPVDFSGLTMNNPFEGVPLEDIKGKKLKDYFPKFRTAQYRYDFGDNWFHSIELEEIVDEDEFGKPLPYLIESSGVAPMEDTGGTERFSNLLSSDYDKFDEEEFLALIKDWFEERDLILQAPGSLAPLFDSKEDS